MDDMVWQIVKNVTTNATFRKFVVEVDQNIDKYSSSLADSFPFLSIRFAILINISYLENDLIHFFVCTE